MGEAVRSAGEGQALPDGPITYEAFLAGYDGVHAEWVEGWVVPMSPVNDEHAKLCAYLMKILGAYLDTGVDGFLVSEPFQMKTGPELPGRSPDILFVAGHNVERVHRNYLEGPADLTIEIISPDSRARDRGEKYYEYETGGVREYWLLDPARQLAEFYQLDADGVFRLVRPDDEGVFRSVAMPGLWLKVTWLWERPTVIQLLRAWGAI